MQDSCLFLNLTLIVTQTWKIERIMNVGVGFMRKNNVKGGDTAKRKLDGMN